MSPNNSSNGRFHSDWLSMIYPRLKLARNLLTDDGLLFVSIDDGEVANLRKVLDEIFGEQGLVAELIWKNKYNSWCIDQRLLKCSRIHSLLRQDWHSELDRASRRN